MTRRLRSLARRLLAVRRTPTYYLPWLARPGLECALILSNVEARFKPGRADGLVPVVALQYGADGSLVRRYQADLAEATESLELPLEPGAGGCGFVTVHGEGIESDLYVTLSERETYTATHGRGEFLEHYPAPMRLAAAMLGGLLALIGRTIPVFARDQYAYAWPDSCSHLLLMNLSDMTNRIRVTGSADGGSLRSRLLRLPPMGSHLLDVSTLVPRRPPSAGPCRLRLEGNAWFNLYVVGTGSGGLAGSLSLMHVK